MSKLSSGDTVILELRKTDRETHISFLYSDIKVGKLEEIIEELKMNQFKLLSHLENCKSTVSDLVDLSCCHIKLKKFQTEN